ncbi:MAG: DMT family transporter [Alphaproteobacteria bacterium]|nr:DMT family transporter [Alphaproteobacteria bacterium]
MGHFPGVVCPAMTSPAPSIERASADQAALRQRALRFSAIALAIGIVCISFSPVFVKQSEVGPTATAFYRMGFALPALTAWVLIESHGKVQERPTTKRDWWLLVLCGLLFTADLICWHASIRLTNVANATFLGNLGTLVVTVGAWAILRERITAGFAGGMAMALGGVALLMGATAAGHAGGLLGDGIGLLTAVFYGSYLLVVKIARERGLASGLIMLTSGAVSTAGFIIAAWVLGESIIPATMFGWWMLIGIALVTQALGQGLVTVSMRHLPGTVVAVSLLMNPVLSAVFAWGFLGETLSTFQAIGCAVVLAGIAVAQTLNKPGKRP